MKEAEDEYDEKVEESKQNEKNPPKGKTGCEYICLAGGFSESKYFNCRLQYEFGKEFEIISKNKPILTVVKGAALLGNGKFGKKRKKGEDAVLFSVMLNDVGSFAVLVLFSFFVEFAP